MGEKYNMKNPAVKRIMQEVKEMQSNPSDDFMSFPLEENIFEWQFAIRGPQETEFEGGIYHGRIQLPSEYPFKPPSFMLLTPNGRFETQTKICLSISNHHPEHWQPSWSVRTALVALIAFMPTNPNGALGSLDFKPEERRVLAVKSREAAPKFGNPERQKLIDEIHEYMLSKASPAPQHSSPPTSDEQVTNGEAGEAPVNPQIDGGDITNDGVQNLSPAVIDRVIEEPIEAPVNENVTPEVLRISREVHTRNQVLQTQDEQQVLQTQDSMVQKAAADDRLFMWAAVGLTIAIAVLVLKKFMKASGYGAVFMDES